VLNLVSTERYCRGRYGCKGPLSGRHIRVAGRDIGRVGQGGPGGPYQNRLMRMMPGTQRAKQLILWRLKAAFMRLGVTVVALERPLTPLHRLSTASLSGVVKVLA
jgi:hypothetical protein